MKWTDQKINKLKKLWEQGNIATDIAKVFGTTKGSIIGKANRLNCTPRKHGGTLKIKRPHTIFKYEPQKITPITEPENPTLLVSLTNNQCKFPLWEKPDEPQLFCGKERWDKSSYCKIHTENCYIKTQPTNEERKI